MKKTLKCTKQELVQYCLKESEPMRVGHGWDAKNALYTEQGFISQIDVQCSKPESKNTGKIFFLTTNHQPNPSHEKGDIEMLLQCVDFELTD